MKEDKYRKIGLKIESGAKPKTAFEDVDCYKVLYRGNCCGEYYLSPFQLKRYELKKKNEPVNIRLENDEITEGYHSFANIGDAFYVKDRLDTFVGEFYEIVIARCVIPNGYLYYEGVDYSAARDDEPMPRGYASECVVIEEILGDYDNKKKALFKHWDELHLCDGLQGNVDENFSALYEYSN